MLAHRKAKFESLEKRLALTVAATVTAGDLIVSGDADGDVVITSTGNGDFTVTDNGVAVGGTLTSVTDDIQIKLDQSAGADNKVTLDLGTQTVDQVFASLGDGTNSLAVTDGGAASFVYKGGSGADTVALTTPVSGDARVKLGDGDNRFTLNGTAGELKVKGGSGADTVTLAAAVAGDAYVNLGNGDNNFTLSSSVEGYLNVYGGSGVDTVSLAAGSSVTESAKLALGGGNNVASLAGSIGESLYFDGRAGNDSLTIESTASITEDLNARLGAGDNVVVHNGTVNGDFNVTSANANDTVTIDPAAVIGGTQNVTLGEQTNGHGGGCGSSNSLRSTVASIVNALRNATTPRNAVAAQLAAAIGRLRR